MKFFALLSICILSTVLIEQCDGRSARKNDVESPRIKVKLLRVLDGDTADVEDPNGKKVRVRFRYIDAPEKAQPYGKESTQFLKDIAEKNMELDVHKVDLYGRTIGELYTSDLNLNKAMVDNGYAWCYRNKCPESYRAGLELAQEEKIGLWAGDNPQSPWDYRKSRRRSKVTLTGTDEIIAALKKIKDERKGKKLIKVDFDYVSDGDTITVINRKTKERMKIRMTYIDAPESSQEGGQESKQFLKDTMQNFVDSQDGPRAPKLSVRVYGKDRYGRYLGVILIGRKDVNKLMVKSGHAWCYLTGCPSGYLTGMKKARKSGIGLWEKKNPTAPWIYRKQSKKQG